MEYRQASEWSIILNTATVYKFARHLKTLVLLGDDQPLGLSAQVGICLPQGLN